MIRVKLPFGGVTPSRWSLRRRAPRTRAARQGPHHHPPELQFHHVPLSEATDVHPDDLRRRPLQPRGLRQHRPQRDRRPVGGRLRGRAFDCTPYAGAYVRYIVRHPTTQLMPRKFKTRSLPPTRTARSPIHDIAFSAQREDGEKGFEMRVGGGTSIMPRIRARAVRFRRGRERRVPRGRRGRLPRLRPPGLAAPEPRARADQVLRRQVRDRGVPPPGRRGAQARLGHERDFRRRGCASTHDEERDVTQLPRAPTPRSRTATARDFDRWARQRQEAEARHGFTTVAGDVIRGDLSPEQFRGLAQLMRDFSGGYARTTHQPEPGPALGAHEAPTPSGSGSSEIGLGDPGAGTLIDTRRAAPAPTPASSASPLPWGSTARYRSG